MLDRIDIQVEIVPVPFDKLTSHKEEEHSEQIRERVLQARERQSKLFTGTDGVYCNAQMSGKQIRRFCRIDDACNALLQNAMERLGLSARAYDRILKVARTIADLEGSENIEAQHIAEAISYRNLDRENWAG